ncbi:N-acetyltransferase [Streptosporangiaceae bacterium NEAU-GS5]|nr:N-acetyltransferase [Streptosporangiaceae bacterium NEAU-GS5]
MFVPEDFAVPVELVTEDFRLAPLGPEHNESDHAAWVSSIDHIRTTPGFAGRSWPPADGMTLTENLADLTHHAEEFTTRAAFAYTVLDPAGGDVIGCVYLRPPGRPGSDVDVLSWVRADRAHLDGALYRAVSAWLRTSWPFTEVRYAPRSS